MRAAQRRATGGSKPAPGPVGLRMRRLLIRMSRPFRLLARTVRHRRRSRKGVDSAPRWRRRWGSSVVLVLVCVGALAWVVWVARAVAVVSGVDPADFPLNADAGCREMGYSCGVMGGIVMSLLTLALGSAIFLLHRLHRIRGPYKRKAKTNPAAMVPTVGAVHGDVVGRDELCNVIMDDLRNRDGRRPHILIGGVGTGKTAVLVQLTRVLAQHGAVPVVIRLRDAQSELNFRGLAQKRFTTQVESSLRSGGEGDKVWRQLLHEDRIVVLADGLEEAFAGTDAEQDRDNLIRLAIADAQEQNLPLVIASRPHDPLSGMKAAMLDLEPLSQEAALDYLRGTTGGLDERLEWLVESAGVAEAPLYLQIAKQLHDKGLLRHTHPSRRSDQLDTRGVDRVALRLRLIDTWVRALAKGHFHADFALSTDDRRATLEHLSALACIGLRHDSLHVKFDDLVGSPTDSPPATPALAAQGKGKGKVRRAKDRRNPGHPRLADALDARLATINQPQYAASPQRLNCAIAATNGMRLGLVEPYRDGVRFQHSIMQAYLGSRMIATVAEDDDFMDAALREPGRELLMALVLYSRSRFDADPGNGAPVVRLQADAEQEPVYAARIRDRIRAAAGSRNARDAKTLDMLASALEIDAVVARSVHQELAAEFEALWKQVTITDRTVEDAKLRAVARFGEAARTIALRAARARDHAVPAPAYERLFAIGSGDESYRVRIAAAQEIGVGGDPAFDALRPTLRRPPELVRPSVAAAEDEHLDDVERAADTRTTDSETRERSRRSETMRAWLAPMLVGSTHDRAAQASQNLDVWLSHVGSDARMADPCLPLSVEVALAQGFKHAANRRPEHPLFRAEVRDDLSERAREMLGNARFWFSRLTLVQALCLWALPETPTYSKHGKRPIAPAGFDPEALVDRWLGLPPGEQEHPFVVEARKLAVLALETGQPERFMWIDESGVVMKVGTRAAGPGVPRRHQLWIPPSTGWSSLHPQAQRLVGDVLLLLNLAERGRDPEVRDRRLNRARRNDLPPCLTADRTPLNPTQTIGTAKSSAPGTNCKHGCGFDLCPYPPKGEQTYRSELSEAFCRRQQTLLGGRLHRTAPWQAALSGELKSFWAQMEERARR